LLNSNEQALAAIDYASISYSSLVPLGPINAKGYTIPSSLGYGDLTVTMWEVNGSTVSLEVSVVVSNANGASCQTKLNKWVTGLGLTIDTTSSGKTYAMMQLLAKNYMMMAAPMETDQVVLDA